MTNATNAAIAKISKPKKGKAVSQAKQETAPLPMPQTTGPEFGMMAVSSITVLEQVRTEFDEDSLRELASDIAERGILQPLTVTKTDAGYVLVAGERRLRAAKLAALEAVPVLICDMSEDAHHSAQLAENIQRDDLTTWEVAGAIRKLSDLGHSVSDIATMVHKSKPWVSKRLAASHHNLSWQAKQIIEEGLSEDLELVLTVDAVAKLDYYEGNKLLQAVKTGNAGRESARQKLAEVKERATTLEAERKEKDAQRNDPAAKAKREREKVEYQERQKKADEERRFEMHVDPIRIMMKFWDWASESDLGAYVFWEGLDGDQKKRLTDEIDVHYAAGQGQTISQFASYLIMEYVKGWNNMDTPNDWQTVATAYGVGKAEAPCDPVLFLEHYANKIIRRIQAPEQE